MGSFYNPDYKPTQAQQVAMYTMRKKNRLRRIQAALVSVTVLGGPIGAWNALSGIDSSGNGYNLTVTETGVTAASRADVTIFEADWLEQLSEADLVFDGSTGFMAVVMAQATWGLGDFSINFWMNPVSPWGGAVTEGIIGQKLADASGGWQVYCNSVENFGCPGIRMAGVGGSNQIDFFTATPVEVGVWTMLTFVRTEGVCYWYINGELDATTTPSPAINIVNDGNDSLNIGYASTWTAYYKGAMNHISLWDRALDPATEINTLYTGDDVNE